MKLTSKITRYGKPCMTNLPPELGQSIFHTIMTAPPADRTVLKRETTRAKRRIRQIVAEIDRNEAAGK